MTSFTSKLIVTYSKKGIIVDTNLFLLYTVGLCNEKRIGTFKRTKQYEIGDYYLLGEFISKFENILITPNILTEVSNFLNQLHENEKQEYYLIFNRLIKHLSEKYVESNRISSDDKFYKFGLTDIGIRELSKGPFLVLTDDLKLYSYLSSEKIDTINFNHIRSMNM